MSQMPWRRRGSIVAAWTAFNVPDGLGSGPGIRQPATMSATGRMTNATLASASSASAPMTVRLGPIRDASHAAGSESVNVPIA